MRIRLVAENRDFMRYFAVKRKNRRKFGDFWDFEQIFLPILMRLYEDFHKIY